MPYDSVYSEKRPPGTLRTAWRKFYSDAAAMVGLYGCAGLAVLCIFGAWFAPYGIDKQILGYQLLPPSWSRYGEVSFFLGTDDLGRDVLSRLLSGAAPTVGGAFVVTLAATICGLVLGTFAGATHGLRSAVLNHILDTLLAIPSLLLAIIVVAFAYQLLPPSWSRYGEVSFFLGTDDLGRDVLSRLLSGAAPTVGGAFVVTLAATICGLVLGTFAGATHGLRSAVLNHILDTLLAIPSLLLAIIVVAFAGPSLSHAMFAVWLALLPRMVRSIYSMVHDELEKEYVIAARLDGASTLNILWFAVMPNITAGLVTEITRALSMAILDIAALGFLDLGAQLPSPEWGAMLGDALELIYVAPWTVMLPGAAIMISVIAALGFLDLGAQLPSPEWGAMLGDALELIYVAPWTVMLPGAAIMISVLLVNLLGDGVRRAIIAGVE